MYIILAIINIIAIIVLLIGLFHDFKNPKSKAIFGYFVVGSLFLYVVMMSIATIYGLFIKPDLYCLILFLCAISPFIIGKLVKYETLKKYTVVQIICYIISLCILCISF